MYKKLLFVFAVLIALGSIFYVAQASQPVLTIPQGGTATGVFTTTGNAIYYTGTKLQTAPTNSHITIPYASTTAVSAAEVCLTNDTCRSSWPTGGGGSGVGTIATSSLETKGQIPYFTTTSGYPARVKSIATTSLSASSPITVTGTLGALIGGSNATLGCQIASASQAGCLSSSDWTTFNNKDSFGYLFPSNATSTKLTFNAGLLSLASTTIGSGTRKTGLTISGGSTTTLQAYFKDRVGIGTSSPKELLNISQSTGYATARLDSGVHSGYISVNDIFPAFNVGSNSNDPLQFVVHNSPVGQFDTSGNFDIGATANTQVQLSSIPTYGYLNIQGAGSGDNGENTIVQVKAPTTNCQEATLTLSRDAGSSNREFTDITNENYNPSAGCSGALGGGIDHFFSINISKQGTGTLIPFVLRFWNQDAGSIAAKAVNGLFVDPSGAVAFGNYASTTSNSSNRYDKTVPLQVSSSTASTIFAIDTTPRHHVFQVTSGGVASTTGLTISNIASCSGSSALTTNSSGVVACGSISGGGGTFAWTPTTNFGATANSTSTPIWFKSGLQASSTSQLVNGIFSGDIGIGTSSPRALLGIQSTTALNKTTPVFEVASSSGYQLFGILGNRQININNARAVISDPANFNWFFGDCGTLTATGQFNTCLGRNALNVLAGGASNMGIGLGSLGNDTSGSRNVGVGVNTIAFNVSGVDNVGIGDSAGLGTSGSSPSRDVFLGASSGKSVSTGSGNVFAGYAAGKSITSGAGNIVLGQNVDIPSASGSGQLNIGNLIFGTGLYNNSSTLSSTPVAGFVGIGTSSPYATLSVAGASGVVAGKFTATSTGSAFNGLTLSNITGSTQCLHVNSLGVVSGTGSDCGSASGGAAFAWTPTTNFGRAVNATTSTIWFKDPSTAGTKFALIASGTAMFANATTSELTITGTPYFPGVHCGENTCLFKANTGSSDGQVQGIGWFPATNGLLYYTAAGEIDGSTKLTFDGTTFTTTDASTTALSSGYASSTKAYFGTLTLPNVSGSTQCLHVNSSGVISGTGSDCGSGSGAVTSVSNSDGSLTISPTTGAVIASLALGHSNTWTAKQTINFASTTAITASGEVVIPHSTSPSLSNSGEIAINTTAASSSLRYYDGTAMRSLYPDSDRVFSFASSTLSYEGGFGPSGTTTILLGNYNRPVTLVNFYCKTNAGTVFIQFGDGTASTTGTAKCTSSGLEEDSLSNNTWTRRENFFIAIGTSASSPSIITVTADIRQDKD